jgi:hypothetical protein
MVPMTQSDAGALEHILGIIFTEPPPTAASATICAFHACFSKAGIVKPQILFPWKPMYTVPLSSPTL